MSNIKNPRLAFAGAIMAAGSLLAISVLPVSQTFAASPPHLSAHGPAQPVSVGANATVTGDVTAATGIPYYQFRMGNKILQRYSSDNHYVSHSLAAGKDLVTVRSLGLGQMLRGKWADFRSTEVHIMVGNPSLSASGPTDGIAKTGDTTINARVIDSFATPYFQFTVNGKITQTYSTNDSLALTQLAPGTYRIVVESLGTAQYHRGAFGAARKETLRFTVPTPPVSVTPTLSVANAEVGTGRADTVTATGIPNNAAVTWSIVSQNGSTGLLSGTGNTASFVATAEGTYTVQALVDGATATAKVVVYGQTAGVSFTPSSNTIVADHGATDAITETAVDASGNTVANFNGTVTVNAVSGVTYSQNGSTLVPVNGAVSVMLRNGSGTFDVGGITSPGLTVAITGSGLTSTNGQTVAQSPTYANTTIASIPQVATGLKMVGAPAYLDSNSQSTQTAPIAVVVEDQSGYPMLTGTDSIVVTVSGPGTLVNATNHQLALAYSGDSNAAGSNLSATFAVASQQGLTGPIVVTAKSTGLASATSTINAVVTGVPSKMTALLSAHSFAEGSAGLTLNLQAEDAGRAPVADTEPVMVTVTKTGSTTPASNILVNGSADTSSTQVNLNGSGAIAVILADSGHGANAGTYTVTISPSANASKPFASQTLTFTETDGVLSQAVFTKPSTAVTVPLTHPTAPYTLQLEDAYGNPLSQAGVSVQIYAVGTSTTNAAVGQATVNGTATSASHPMTVTTNAAGQATVTLAAEAYAGASWVLDASVPVQSGMMAALTRVISPAMQVSNQVVDGLGLAMQDVSTGADFQSTGYAVAGNIVDATVTVDNQYGVPLTGNQTVKWTIPAGLSGQAPSGSTDANAWTQGSSNTVTLSMALNQSGHAMIPLEAWSEGSATLNASVPGGNTTVAATASIFVQPGISTTVGLFNNGGLISGNRPLAVAANTPVAVMVETTDIAGNPVASTGSQVIALNPTHGGSFRLTASGAPITTVTIPAGQTSETVYYVNAATGTYTPLATLDAYQLAVDGPLTYTVANGMSQAIHATLTDASGNAVHGQTVTASVPSREGTVTSPRVSSSNGAVSFSYTAPASGSGTATITLNVPGVGTVGSTLSQNVTVQY